MACSATGSIGKCQKKTFHIEDSSLSEPFEMLSHEYRRRGHIAVAQANPRDEDEITSESIADREDDKTLAVLQQELYHIQLPKLNDAEFIDRLAQGDT